MSTVSIGEVKSYWDRRPCNIRHGVAPIGTDEWSEQVTKRKYFVEPHIPGFAQFSRWAGRKVLELGCGIGTDTLSFLEAGATVDAIDISNESLFLAQGRTLKYQERNSGTFPRVRFFNADIEEFAPVRKYSLVYAFGVLHHTPNPVRALNIAYDRLTPGGEMRAMLYARWSWKNLFTLQQPEAQAGCPLAVTYSVREARELFERAGFRVTNIRKTHIFSWRVKDYVKHQYVKAFPWSLVPPWLFTRLEKLFGWHLLITAVKPMGWRRES